MFAADINRRSTMPDEDEKPKKLPLAEKEARWDTVKAKYVGLELEGELEPSDSLVDKFVQMEECGQLRYIKWEEFTRKNQEVRGVKKDEFWKEDPVTGALKRFQRDNEVTIDLGDDKLQMKYALQRRGLALELANIMSFDVHEKLVNRYFLEMSREQLPGYGKVTVDQIRMTDKEVFARLGEHSRKGYDSIELPFVDQLPLDPILIKVLDEVRIATLLMPLPGYSRSAPKHESNKREQQVIEGLQSQIKKLRQNKDNEKNGKANGNGKGNGKKDKNKDKDRGDKRGKKRTRNVPQGLIGMSSVANGKPLCFDYNLPHGCTTTGESRCPRGEHCCAFPGCQGEHSLQKCPKKR